MDHTPFIIGAYSAFAVVLLWCAFAPLLRARNFRARLIQAFENELTQDEREE